jgi:aryl-alcohol dehydrogenase-like predicted oxidoreductase
MTQMALKWILMFPEVSCTIPGAKRPEQAEENITASDLPPLSGSTMEKIRKIYNQYAKPYVHHYW